MGGGVFFQAEGGIRDGLVTGVQTCALPIWRDGYAKLERLGYSFDLQIPYWHLDQATDLAADFPETTLVINHTGLPSDRSDLGFSAWSNAIEQVAQKPNVMIKISGLGQTNQPWTVESNRNIVLRALDI